MHRSADPSPFNQRVYEIVCAIPPGRVITYGKIAVLIPPPAGVDSAGYSRVRARWVGYAMAACPDNVPWQRVINAQGRISKQSGFGSQIQRGLLEAEGVVFDDKERVDLNVFGWEPEPDFLIQRGLLPPPAPLISVKPNSPTDRPGRDPSVEEKQGP